MHKHKRIVQKFFHDNIVVPWDCLWLQIVNPDFKLLDFITVHASNYHDYIHNMAAKIMVSRTKPKEWEPRKPDKLYPKVSTHMHSHCMEITYHNLPRNYSLKICITIRLSHELINYREIEYGVKLCLKLNMVKRDIQHRESGCVKHGTASLL